MTLANEKLSGGEDPSFDSVTKQGSEMRLKENLFLSTEPRLRPYAIENLTAQNVQR